MAVIILYREKDEERTLIRFLQASDWNYKKTVESLNYHIKAKEGELLIDMNSVATTLPLGLFYYFGRDKVFRPSMIINTRAIINSKAKENTLRYLLLYCIEWGIKNLLVSGKVETFNAIIDLTKVGVFEIPVSILKNIISTLQKNYRCRMFKLYVYNPPMIIKGIFKVVKPLLNPFTQAKVNFINKDKNILLEDLPADQVEEKFGGKAPNQCMFLPPTI